MKKDPSKNFADGKGYNTPRWARPLLSLMPSVHQKDQPPSFNILAGPYNEGEYKAALKAVTDYSRAGKPLAIVYTRTIIFIAEETSRELLALRSPVGSSHPVQSPIIPGRARAFRVAPFIIPHLPEHHTFLDVLGTDASVLMLKPRAAFEIYHDRADEIGNLFSVLRSKGSALAQLLALTPYQPEKFRKSAGEDHHDPLERARRAILRLAHAPDRESWRTYQNALPGIVDRLRDVHVLESLPVRDLIAEHDLDGIHLHFDFLGSGGRDFLPEILGIKKASVSILDDVPHSLTYQHHFHVLPGDLILTKGVGAFPSSPRRELRAADLPQPLKLPTPEKKRATPRLSYPARSEAAEIRHGLRLSQKDFAALLGIPVNTLRQWETGKQIIPASGRALLRIAKTNPSLLRYAQADAPSANQKGSDNE